MKSISEVLSTGPPEAARNRTKEEKMRTKFAILLAVAAVCVTTAWAGWFPEGQITSNRLKNDLRVNINRKVVVAIDVHAQGVLEPIAGKLSLGEPTIGSRTTCA